MDVLRRRSHRLRDATRTPRKLICTRYRAEFPDEQERYGAAGIAWWEIAADVLSDELGTPQRALTQQVATGASFVRSRSTFLGAPE